MLRRKAERAPLTGPPGPAGVAGGGGGQAWPSPGGGACPCSVAPSDPWQESPGCPCLQLPAQAPVGDSRGVSCMPGGVSPAHRGGPGHAASTHQTCLQPAQPQPWKPLVPQGTAALSTLQRGRVLAEPRFLYGLYQWENDKTEGSRGKLLEGREAQRLVRTPEDRLAPPWEGVLPGRGATPCSVFSLRSAGDEPPPPYPGGGEEEEAGQVPAQQLSAGPLRPQRPDRACPAGSERDVPEEYSEATTVGAAERGVGGALRFQRS